MKKLPFFGAIALLVLACKQNESASPLSAAPSLDYLPRSTTGQVVHHDYYSLSYNEKYEQAEWVAYHLKKSDLAATHYERPFFIEDPQVRTQSADWRNYKQSGYDKGHLCPAADRKFSKKAFEQTFFTSNIAPQRHDFNEGIWNRLEQKTRYWASLYNGVFVVTGGVLRPGLNTIGKEKVAVPEYFYKIIFKPQGDNSRMIGFLVPAKDSNKPLYDFVVPVDQIEKMTGIDFFPALKEVLENRLEQNSSYKSWAFNE